MSKKFLAKALSTAVLVAIEIVGAESSVISPNASTDKNKCSFLENPKRFGTCKCLILFILITLYHIFELN